MSGVIIIEHGGSEFSEDLRQNMGRLRFAVISSLFLMGASVGIMIASAIAIFYIFGTDIFVSNQTWTAALLANAVAIVSFAICLYARWTCLPIRRMTWADFVPVVSLLYLASLIIDGDNWADGYYGETTPWAISLFHFTQMMSYFTSMVVTIVLVTNRWIISAFFLGLVLPVLGLAITTLVIQSESETGLEMGFEITVCIIAIIYVILKILFIKILFAKLAPDIPGIVYLIVVGLIGLFLQISVCIVDKSSAWVWIYFQIILSVEPLVTEIYVGLALLFFFC